MSGGLGRTVLARGLGSLLPSLTSCFQLRSSERIDTKAKHSLRAVLWCCLCRYVKNLPPEADELYLYQKFSPHGALISCKIKIDPVTGKCRYVTRHRMAL